MKPMNGFKGYSAFSNDNDDTVSFVSGRLSGASFFGEGAEGIQAPKTAADAQRKLELQSLLLMASLMLGGSGAASA
jgi:hypothetical protein